MKTNPILLNSFAGPAQNLKRIESQPSSDKNESWLQKLIFDNPSLLPVEHFDESFAPLIPLGREISTAIGNIDNLYVSPMGQLTIVETKLWKNPEKHRTVVAQIIDYAKELSKWTYDDLERAVLKVARREDASQIKSLDQLINPYLQDANFTLPDFQERIVRNLQSGDFLLLIVGDRISPNIAMLSDAIHGAPGLGFTIGLIELQLHPLSEGSDWPLIVVPDIVGRTNEYVRGIIKVRYEQEQPRLTIEVEEEPIIERRGRINKQTFLRLVSEDLQPVYDRWLDIWSGDENFNIYWGTTGFSLRILVGGKLESVFYGLSEWGVTLVKESDAQRIRAIEVLYKKYLDTVNNIPAAANTLAAGKTYLKEEYLTAESLDIIAEATYELAQNIRD